MADKKISADSNLASPAAGDLIPIVDIDVADNLKNKTITWSQITSLTWTISDITDIDATAAEINILDLSATVLTAGWVYAANGTSTASWRQLLGSEISNTEGWTSNAGTVTSVTGGTGLSSTGGTTPSISHDAHTGQVTGSTALSLDVTAITAQPAAGAINGGVDTMLINDGGTLSEVTFTQLNTYFDANLSFVTSVSVGTGLDIVNPTTTPAISLDFTEITAGGTLVAGDYLMADNGSANSRQLISSIPLSIFNDDLGHVENATHTGQVTGSTALSLDITAITGQTATTICSGLDEFLVSDGGLLRRVDMNRFIAGQGTSLTTGLAGTDELLISDNGTIKKMDVSVMNAYFNSNLSFGNGTVTAVNNGNGMNFTNITSSGTVTLGTPGTLSGTSTNAVTTSSHTHAVTFNEITVATTSDTTTYPVLVGTSTAGAKTPLVDAGFIYNASTNALDILGPVTGGGFESSAAIGMSRPTTGTSLIFNGGTAGDGGTIELHGSTDADAGNVTFYGDGGTTPSLEYDHVAATWTMGANIDFIINSGEKIYWGATTDSFLQSYTSSGQIYYDAISGTSPYHRFRVDSSDKADIRSDQIRVHAGAILMKELAASVTDVSTFGQLYVKNTTPQELWFVDEAGTATQIV